LLKKVVLETVMNSGGLCGRNPVKKTSDRKDCGRILKKGGVILIEDEENNIRKEIRCINCKCSEIMLT
jgi:hypothetical protein